jgi:hypothetical protein
LVFGFLIVVPWYGKADSAIVHLGLLGLLLLQVLVAEVCDQTTQDDDSVDTDASRGLVSLAGGRGSVDSGALGLGVSGLALQGAHQELVQALTGLVTVADILECLGSILATNIEKDLLTTARNPVSTNEPETDYVER